MKNLKKEESCYRYTIAADNKEFCIEPSDACGGVETKCKGNIELCEECENAKRPI